MQTILVVGGSDTGRAPLAAILLREQLGARAPGVEVGSAGVLGHDGDDLQPEAAIALQQFGITPPEHQARSLNAGLLESTTLIVAIDRGTGKAFSTIYKQARDRLVILPELADARDIPDPTRMSIDAWVIYARQLHEQIQQALPKIVARLKPPETRTTAESGQERREEEQTPLVALDRLLVALELAPQIVDWQRARQALTEQLAACGAAAPQGDLAPAVVALLHGLLAQQPDMLRPGQLAWLKQTIALFRRPIEAITMAQIAGEAVRWNSL